MTPRRGASLNLRLALTLAAAAAVLMALFVGVLVPFQQGQRARMLERDTRLVSTLRQQYERELIYDLLSRNRESLAVDLAELARQPGLLWVTVHAEGVTLSATADPETRQQVLAGTPSPEAEPGDVLLIGETGDAAFLGSGVRAVVVGRIPPERVEPWFRDPVALAPGAFSEVPWPTGVPALLSEAPLQAADQVFGRLHIVYSLAELQRTEVLTRNLAYLLATSVVVVLLLLLNVMLSRSVVRPVRRVAEAMRRASGGDLSVRLPVASGDEIGAMAEAFNHMVTQLEQSRREIEGESRRLERAVEERTQDLQEVSHHLEAVIAHAATGVLSLDGEGRVSTYNRRAVEILDLPAAPAGRPLSEVLSGEARAVLEIVERARREGVVKAQLDLRLPPGRRTLAVVATSPPGGHPRLDTVVVVEDLTQVLDSQRLSAWKEAVERVIHEIKNPLTPIGLSTEMLRTAFVQDRARFDQLFPSASEMVLKSVRDLKALITEFTRFSRMPRVVLQPLDVNAVLTEVLTPWAAPGEDGVRVEAHLAPALPSVPADAEQLKRVFLNVVQNAVEAMAGRTGGVRVRSGAQGSAVVVTVEDDGVGIADPERLFQPYHTTKAKGTGLGLVISKQIMDEHGGHIEVASTVGVGTVVRIRLPAGPIAAHGLDGTEPPVP